MPKNRQGKGKLSFRAISPAARFQVLLDEYQHGAGRVLEVLTNLAAQLSAARKGLAEGVDRLNVPAEPRTRASFQRLARAERLLSQARESLSEVGWAALEASGEVKRLQAEIAKLSQRFEAHEKAHAT